MPNISVYQNKNNIIISLDSSSLEVKLEADKSLIVRKKLCLTESTAGVADPPISTYHRVANLLSYFGSLVPCAPLQLMSFIPITCNPQPLRVIQGTKISWYQKHGDQLII